MISTISMFRTVVIKSDTMSFPPVVCLRLLGVFQFHLSFYCKFQVNM